MTTKIVIRERGDNYMAFGSGKVVASAVGDLVLSHQTTCDVKIRDYEGIRNGTKNGI